MPLRNTAPPWRLWMGCAAAGIIAGVLLRVALGLKQPEPSLPLEAAEEEQVARLPQLPPSLKEFEPELQRTLTAAHQAATDAKERERLLEALAERLGPADFAEAARRGLELPPEERRIYLMAVIRRWAEHNGASAIVFAASRAPEDLREALINEALDRWSSVEASAALEWILRHSQNEEKTERLHRFIRSVEENAPAIALAAIEKLPRSGGNEVIRQQLARRLAETDLPGAITALLRGWQDDPSTRSAAADLAERWLEQDPAGALAWVGQIRDTHQRSMFGARLAAAWARKDPNAALEWVKSQPSGDRSYMLSSVITEWTVRDPRAAREYALGLPEGEDRAVAIFSVACEIGIKHGDARGFLEVHQQLDSPQGNFRRAELFRDIIARSRKEYQEGAELLRDLPASEKNQQLFDRYLSRWLFDEPEKAGQFLKDGNLFEKMPEAARNYALQLARKDADSAAKWANELPPGMSRDFVHCAITYGLATEDPERAATILEREVPAHLQPSTARLLAEQWFNKDQQGATAWAQSLNNETARAVACAAIVETWSHKDPTGPVAQWIESLPPGSAYDVAVAAYAGNINATDREAALAWVSTIGDPQLRQLQVESYAKAWLQHDRAEATRWIEQAETLSPEMKQRLLPGKTH